MDKEAFRVVERVYTSRPPLRASRTCGADSCELGTKDGKPYCSDHVLMNSYAQRVLTGLANRQDEVDNLHRTKYQLPEQSILSDEVIQLLRQLGGLSLDGSAKQLHISREKMGRLAAIMKRRKIITLFKNKRNCWIMGLL